MQLTLTRIETSDQGTFGKLEGMDFMLYTAELPWRGNARKISCIPCGMYHVEPYSSPKFRNVYHLLDVPHRDGILIHTGNYAGDTSKGYRSDVEGCILLGLKLGYLNNQRAVLSSRDAMTRFRAFVGNDPFDLLIHTQVGVMR